MDIPATQEIFFDDDDDDVQETGDPEVGYLRVEGRVHILHPGKNRIGRDASKCSIVLLGQAVSAEHAVIDCINQNDHLIEDVGSRNKTRIEKKVLVPHTKYYLEKQANLMFGNVTAFYERKSFEPDYSMSMTQLSSEDSLNVMERSDIIIEDSFQDLSTVPSSQDIPGGILNTEGNKTVVFRMKNPLCKTENMHVGVSDYAACEASVKKVDEDAENIFDAPTQCVPEDMCSLSVEEEGSSDIENEEESDQGFNPAQETQSIFDIPTQRFIDDESTQLYNSTQDECVDNVAGVCDKKTINQLFLEDDDIEYAQHSLQNIVTETVDGHTNNDDGSLTCDVSVGELKIQTGNTFLEEQENKNEILTLDDLPENTDLTGVKELSEQHTQLFTAKDDELNENHNDIAKSGDMVFDKNVEDLLEIDKQPTQHQNELFQDEKNITEVVEISSEVNDALVENQSIDSESDSTQILEILNENESKETNTKHNDNEQGNAQEENCTINNTSTPMSVFKRPSSSFEEACTMSPINNTSSKTENRIHNVDTCSSDEDISDQTTQIIDRGQITDHFENKGFSRNDACIDLNDEDFFDAPTQLIAHKTPTKQSNDDRELDVDICLSDEDISEIPTQLIHRSEATKAATTEQKDVFKRSCEDITKGPIIADCNHEVSTNILKEGDKCGEANKTKENESMSHNTGNEININVNIQDDSGSETDPEDMFCMSGEKETQKSLEQQVSETLSSAEADTDKTVSAIAEGEGQCEKKEDDSSQLSTQLILSESSSLIDKNDVKKSDLSNLPDDVTKPSFSDNINEDSNDACSVSSDTILTPDPVETELSKVLEKRDVLHIENLPVPVSSDNSENNLDYETRSPKLGIEDTANVTENVDIYDLLNAETQVLDEIEPSASNSEPINSTDHALQRESLDAYTGEKSQETVSGIKDNNGLISIQSSNGDVSKEQISCDISKADTTVKDVVPLPDNDIDCRTDTLKTPDLPMKEVIDQKKFENENFEEADVSVDENGIDLLLPSTQEIQSVAENIVTSPDPKANDESECDESELEGTSVKTQDKSSISKCRQTRKKALCPPTAKVEISRQRKHKGEENKGIQSGKMKEKDETTQNTKTNGETGEMLGSRPSRNRKTTWKLRDNEGECVSKTNEKHASNTINLEPSMLTHNSSKKTTRNMKKNQNEGEENSANVVVAKETRIRDAGKNIFENTNTKSAPSLMNSVADVTQQPDSENNTNSHKNKEESIKSRGRNMKTQKLNKQDDYKIAVNASDSVKGECEEKDASKNLVTRGMKRKLSALGTKNSSEVELETVKRTKRAGNSKTLAETQQDVSKRICLQLENGVKEPTTIGKAINNSLNKSSSSKGGRDSVVDINQPLGTKNDINFNTEKASSRRRNAKSEKPDKQHGSKIVIEASSAVKECEVEDDIKVATQGRGRKHTAHQISPKTSSEVEMKILSESELVTSKRTKRSNVSAQDLKDSATEAITTRAKRKLCHSEDETNKINKKGKTGTYSASKSSKTNSEDSADSKVNVTDMVTVPPRAEAESSVQSSTKSSNSENLAEMRNVSITLERVSSNSTSIAESHESINSLVSENDSMHSKRGRPRKRTQKLEDAGSYSNLVGNKQKTEHTSSTTRKTRKCSSSSQEASTSRKVIEDDRVPQTYNVLFTGFKDELPNQEALVKKLGGKVVEDPQKCSVLVTDRVRRTVKFLCCVAQGKLIVSPTWLQSCSKKGHFLDPSDYLLKDKESEKKYSFTLSESLNLASSTPLLQEYSVYVTPSVVPPRADMKAIIESCGGTFISRLPVSSTNTFIISCENDKKLWTKFKKDKVRVVSNEILLTGILQQRLDFNTHKLS